MHRSEDIGFNGALTFRKIEDEFCFYKCGQNIFGVNIFFRPSEEDGIPELITAYQNRKEKETNKNPILSILDKFQDLAEEATKGGNIEIFEEPGFRNVKEDTFTGITHVLIRKKAMLKHLLGRKVDFILVGIATSGDLNKGFDFSIAKFDETGDNSLIFYFSTNSHIKTSITHQNALEVIRELLNKTSGTALEFSKAILNNQSGLLNEEWKLKELTRS